MSSEKNGNISAQVDSRLDDLFGDGDEQSENFENKETEAEVSDRIDDIFGESGSGDSAADEAPIELDNPNDMKSGVKESKAPEKINKTFAHMEESSPIKDLKSVILSLEWEISDQVMQRLGEEVVKLEHEYKDDKIVVAFLQLLGSLGKYIQKKRAEAHPDSISLLNSVYENLEQVIVSDELTDAAKKKMLVTEVNKYKKLKEHIASIKTSVPRKKEFKPAEKPAPDYAPESAVEPPSAAGPEEFPVSDVKPEQYTGVSGDEYSEQQLIIQILQEINQTIKSEFQALREELQSWRNS